MTLTKEQILAADDRPTEVLEVPEWGGSVNIRTMSGSERDRFEISIVSTKGDDVQMRREDFRAKLLAACIVDDEGNLIFEPADIPALGQKSAKAMDRCVEVAMRLNGISKKDEDELTKN